MRISKRNTKQHPVFARLTIVWLCFSTAILDSVLIVCSHSPPQFLRNGCHFAQRPATKLELMAVVCGSLSLTEWRRVVCGSLFLLERCR
jgi:hypothetical protein